MKWVAWRIIQARHVDVAFTGDGARLYGGWWNHKGTLMVYAAGVRVFGCFGDACSFGDASITQ